MYVMMFTDGCIFLQFHESYTGVVSMNVLANDAWSDLFWLDRVDVWHNYKKKMPWRPKRSGQ